MCVCERERDLFESEKGKDSHSGWLEIWKADVKEVGCISEYIWTFLSGTLEAAVCGRGSGGQECKVKEDPV